MEKRIKYQQFQQVKSAAKMIDPLKRKMAPLKNKVEALVAEMKSYQTQIDALEAGIVQVIGFHVDELVKKVIEPTGKTDANGKAFMQTKYIPTDIVTYDEQHKEFVVSIPDDSETIVPPTTEDGPGSDFDIDKENAEVASGSTNDDSIF